MTTARCRNGSSHKRKKVGITPTPNGGRGVVRGPATRTIVVPDRITDRDLARATTVVRAARLREDRVAHVRSLDVVMSVDPVVLRREVRADLVRKWDRTRTVVRVDRRREARRANSVLRVVEA